ncbi:MAG: 50S ribosomal protein L21e [Candidatus Bathyarchaeia archaeon]
MGKRSRGYRSRSRHLSRKRAGTSGKVGLSRLLHNYDVNDKVRVIIDSAIHKGMPHRRFHGLVGRVLGRRGKSYVVEVPVSGAVKNIIIRPEHIQPLRGEECREK